MADVVNRSTVQYLRSVNTPDYSDVYWIINPDLSALDGVPQKYWKVVSDTVVEMTISEKNAVDAATPDAILEKAAESAEVSSTSSTSYQQKLRLSTAKLPAGTYRIGWSYDWSMSSLSYSFLGRVRVDSTTDVVNHNEKPKDKTTDVAHVGGFVYVTLAFGVHTIDIDYCTSNSGGAAKIQNARLEIWKNNGVIQ